MSYSTHPWEEELCWQNIKFLWTEKEDHRVLCVEIWKIVFQIISIYFQKYEYQQYKYIYVIYGMCRNVLQSGFGDTKIKNVLVLHCFLRCLLSIISLWWVYIFYYLGHWTLNMLNFLFNSLLFLHAWFSRR